MSIPRPEWIPLWLRCKACDHLWDDWQPTGAPIPVWLAAIECIHCPACGRRGKNIFIRGYSLVEAQHRKAVGGQDALSLNLGRLAQATEDLNADDAPPPSP